jgi:hypothetical protein
MSPASSARYQWHARGARNALENTTVGNSFIRPLFYCVTKSFPLTLAVLSMLSMEQSKINAMLMQQADNVLTYTRTFNLAASYFNHRHEQLIDKL